MHVEELHLRSAPGIGREIRFDGLGPGLVVLVGPNASGKSTLGRVIRLALWPEALPPGLDAITSWREAPGAPLLRATLVHGQVSWDGEPPRIPPEAGASWMLGLGDLLRVDAGAREAFVHVVERELRGGYDLEAVRSAFSMRPQPPPRMVRDVEEARGELRQALARARDLAERESTLDDLRERQRESTDASRLIALLEDARALSLARGRVRDADRDLAALPSGMDRITGQEPETLGRIAEALETARHEDDRVREAARSERERLDGVRFPIHPPEAGEVAAWSLRADGLADLDREVAAAQVSARAATASLREALAGLLLDPDASPTPATPAGIEALEGTIADVAAAAAEAEALRRVLAAVPTPPPGIPDRAALETAIQALRLWLSAPAPAARPSGTRALALGVLGVLLAVAGGWAIGAWASLPGVLLAGVGLGLTLHVLLGSRAPPGDPRAVHTATFRRSGLPEPARWEAEDVARRLAGLEAAAEASGEAEAHARAGRALEAAEARERALRKELAEKAARFGIASDLPGLALVQRAHRLVAVDRARQEDARARAALDATGTALDRGLAEASRWLGGLGLPPSRDVSGVRSAVAAVDRRLRDVQEASRTLVLLERQEASHRRTVEDQARARDAVYRGVGLEPGDDAGLQERIGRLEAWREAREAHRRAGWDVETLAAKLVGHPDLDGVDAAELEDRLARARASAGELEPLANAVAGLETELREALRGRTIETARGRLHVAERALALARDAALADALGRRLVDRVEALVARDHAPELLKAAQRWFLRFTRHAFRLDVDPGGRLVAWDLALGAPRTLAQLSDGTRIQLLLAARLAFLEHVEGHGPRLPLFLDEALSTTDRARFREVGRSLLELAADGRQVIYATADVAEVRAWQALCREEHQPAPRILDLGAREVASAWAEDLAVGPEPPPAVPDPSGHDAVSYARCLGVHPPSPRDPASAWHLLHLLADDLDTLAACIRVGVTTVGQWRGLRATPGLVLPIDPGRADRLDARVQLLETVLELRSVGRGRPVTWEDAVGSGAITAVFTRRVREVLAVHAGDARAFVEAVGRLERFRRTSLDELRAHLLAVGCLDEAEVLSAEAIAERTRERLAPLVSSGGLDLAEIPAFVQWVERVLGQVAT